MSKNNWLTKEITQREHLYQHRWVVKPTKPFTSARRQGACYHGCWREGAHRVLHALEAFNFCWGKYDCIQCVRARYLRSADEFWKILPKKSKALLSLPFLSWKCILILSKSQSPHVLYLSSIKWKHLHALSSNFSRNRVYYKILLSQDW